MCLDKVIKVEPSLGLVEKIEEKRKESSFPLSTHTEERLHEHTGRGKGALPRTKSAPHHLDFGLPSLQSH
jgi:hypothetical protein